MENKRNYSPINVRKEYIPIVKMEALKRNMTIRDYIQELIRKDLKISEDDIIEK